MKKLALFLLMLTLSANMFGATAQERGLQIALEVERQDIGFDDSQNDVIMILKDQHGNERVRQMRNRTLEQTDDGDKSMIIFDSPGDVQGTAFLSFTHKTGDDDQWLFLPALTRVKKISSSNKAGAFMNSEFAFEDIASQEVEKYAYSFLREDSFEGKPVLINELDPADENSGYSKLQVWVDAQRYIPLKIDFFNRGGALKKTLVLSDYQQYLDKFWRAETWTMVNHLTGKNTVLKMQNWKFRNGFDDNDFNKNSLSRAK